MKHAGRRLLDRGLRSCSGAVPLFLAVALGAPVPARAGDGVPDGGAPEAEASRPPPRRKKGDLEWLSLGAGLVRVREKYSPALVLYSPAAASPGDAAKSPEGDAAKQLEKAAAGGFLAEHLADTATRETLRRFVLIRLDEADLDKPYPAPGGKKGGKDGGKRKAGPKDDGPASPGAPPAADAPAEETAAAKLQITAGSPSLVVMSFREEVVRRFEAELPSKSKLRKDLSYVVKVNDIQAGEARRVEPELEASRYAFKLGKTRAAVLKVLPFEEKDSRQRMDTVLAKRVDDLIAEYKGKAKELMSEGDSLDREGKYDDAIKAFDRAQRDFPFTEVIRQASRRKSEILRKMLTPF